MKKLFVPAVLVALLFAACGSDRDEKKPVAKVGDNYLYLDDLRKITPKNLHGNDSTLWVDDFVRRWVQNQLLILNAEQNLSAEQKNVDQELQEYRNSLITYRYKKELMAQKMDTVVTRNEIEAYYSKNRERYRLRNSILKAVYMKIPIEVANVELLKRYAQTEREANSSQLNEYGSQYAKVFNRFGDGWVGSEQIAAQIPEQFNMDEQFLRRNKIIESSDTDYYYFICIRDFRTKGEYAPVEYVSDEIRNIVLNERKIQFLKKIEDDIYQDGVAANKFKIYNSK